MCFYCTQVHVLLACVHVEVPLVARRGSWIPLGLKLQTVVSHHVDARDQPTRSAERSLQLQKRNIFFASVT